MKPTLETPFETLRVRVNDHVAEVELYRPDKANSMTETAFAELEAVFKLLDETPEARVIVLHGAGKHFCAGIDLSLLLSIGTKTADACDGRKREKLHRLIQQLQGTITAVEACRKPVLAAIHGGCIGGGLDLAAACDMRYATTDAYFTIKEIDLGMVADLGSLQRLPKVMPYGVVAELAYTGRRMDGAEAQRHGLVNATFATKEEMLVAVQGIAAEIARKSPLSIRGTKQVLQYARDHSVAEGLQHIALWNAAMILSDDLTEAGKAAMTKAEPKFRD